jgi:hypothetical protein
LHAIISDQFGYEVPKRAPNCESHQRSTIELAHLLRSLSQVAVRVCEVGGGFRNEVLENLTAGEDLVAVYDKPSHQDDERIQDIGCENDGGS